LHDARRRINDSNSLSNFSMTPHGYLSTIVNPSNVASMQTIDINHKQSNVYINTMRNQENPQSSKRKRITIIKRKRRADGSIESVRQNIYKDYGEPYAV
jgi:hypothetical protein